MAGRLLRLFRGLRGKKRSGPAAAPAQQPAEPEQLQALQDDAAQDRTQEQEPSCGCFPRAAKTLRRLLRLGRRESGGTGTEGAAQPDCRPGQLRAEAAAGSASSELAAACEQHTAQGRAEADVALTEGMATTDTQAQGMPESDAMPTLTLTPPPSLEFLQKRGASPQQVRATVGDILQRLASCVTVDAGLQMEILSLAEEHPALVVLSLLCCAPTCDRAAALMWRAIGTSQVAAEEVLPALLSAMLEQPPDGGFFCRRDDETVFSLAATLVLWRIAPMSEWHYAILLHSPQLFLALLWQIFITTEQMPWDAETQSLWRACREEHGLPCEPNRFVVQTMKALLSRLGFDERKLMALEDKQVWEKLLSVQIQHDGAGLLAREVRCGLRPLCPFMASQLLRLLMAKQSRWHLPALAFFVELLECLDLSQHGASALLVVSRYLSHERTESERLALRGLVVLSKEPSLARGTRNLYPVLVQLLADPVAEIVEMSLSVLMHMLQDKDLVLCSTTALRLAEPLLPHFENDNCHVRLLSMQLFGKVMELVAEEGKQHLTTLVNQSLLPLFLHWHDEKPHVAEASGEALLCAARFLRRGDLEELLTKKQPTEFAESLLLQDESRAAEHLRWALPRLRSPQKPVRLTAVGIIGLAGLLVTGQKEELQVLTEALQALKEEERPSCTSILIQLTFEKRSAELRSSAESDLPAPEQDGPAGAPGTDLAAQG